MVNILSSLALQALISPVKFHLDCSKTFKNPAKEAFLPLWKPPEAYGNPFSRNERPLKPKELEKTAQGRPCHPYEIALTPLWTASSPLWKPGLCIWKQSHLEMSAFALDWTGFGEILDLEKR